MYKADDIAIIGMSGRLPGADNLDQFWNSLIEGKNNITDFPESRKDELREIMAELPKNIAKAGYLNEVAMFEPELFEISREECRFMDPQHKILLELVEEALLDAGYNPEKMSDSSVGVYIGDHQFDYANLLYPSSPFSMANGSSSSGAGRVAYMYNFRGPALVFGTGCSSSLVALHYACMSLQMGDVDYALTGGSELILLPADVSDLGQHVVLSLDQSVKTFDKGANGTVSSEGAGMIFLKLANRALADGDHIHAVIKGTAANTNGSWSNGMTAPSEKGQSEVILRAIQRAKIDPTTISFIEAHGTGTRIGDPIEVAGISKALEIAGLSKQSVALASLKTNIGHLKSASGIVGVLKTILALQHRKIPATINFEEPNPLIDFIDSPVYVNDRLTDWHSTSIRRAGVTSLGLTGTNCHVILEERVETEQVPALLVSGQGKELVVLSARTEASLKAMARQLLEYLEEHQALPLRDVAYTLNLGRRSLQKKWVFIVESLDELICQLKEFIQKDTLQMQTSVPSTILVIPDVKDANLTLSANLRQIEPNYCKYYDHCLQELQVTDEQDQVVTYLCQMFAYVKLLEAYSFYPKAVWGIGSGDVIADLVSGDITLADALQKLHAEQIAKEQLDKGKLAAFLDKIIQSGISSFVFLSFDTELSQLFAEVFIEKDVNDVTFLQTTQSSIYSCIAQFIYNKGEVAWEKVYAGEERKRLSLPGYVFERKRYIARPERTVAQRDTGAEVQELVSGSTEPVDLTSIHATLTYMLGEVSSSSEFALEDNIYDLDLDSLDIMQFAGKLKRQFNVDVPLKLFFDNRPIGEIFVAIEEVIVAAASGENHIEAQPKEAYYPVSSAQKRLYILNQFDSDSISYNIPGMMTIEGALDYQRFTWTCQELVRRHEAFRTSFQLVDGVPVQKIHSEVEFTIQFYKASESELKERAEQFIRPFDLEQAPLLRVQLVQVSADKYIFMYDMHHIISDGTSIGVMIQDFINLYADQNVPDLRIQYKDFAVWQNQLFNSETMQKQEKYWLDQFAGEIPVLNLSTDYPRPVQKSYAGDRIIFNVDSNLTAGLADLAASNDATLYMVLLTAYNVLLSRYSGQSDIVVGSPIAGRPHADLENIIGMFVNTLAMRNYPLGSLTVREFLDQVKRNSLQAFEYQDYQFEMLVDKINLPRDLSRHPVFDVLFTLQNMRVSQLTIPGLQFSPYEFEVKVAKFDLNLSAIEEGDHLVFDLEYSTNLFKPDTIERMAGHFVKILQQMVVNLDIRLEQLDLLTAEEEREFAHWNNTQIEYPLDKLAHRLFEEQVQRSEKAVALVFADKEFTFAEINQRANQLARLLVEKGVGPEQIVGILVERSPEMVIAILGVLKAGGAFLPIDPADPEGRIDYMLEDSHASILLTQSYLAARANFTGETLFLDSPAIYQGDDANLEERSWPHSLCYVIYTSGTTGKPKGVMIEHHSLVNYILGFNRKAGLMPGDSTIILASYSFDGVYTNFWWPLTSGKTLHIISEDTFKDPNLLIRYVQEHAITFLKGTPSLVNGLLKSISFARPDSLSSLKVLMVGGEAARVEDLALFNQQYPNVKIINHYGPTEATIGCVSIIIEGEELEHFLERPVIGQPHDNMRIYIVSECGNLQPIGIAGELCIAGEGLARGYLNRPDLTETRFVACPFESGQKMYRTGDLARWTPDGQIEFLGRKDTQVKIRGYRVELAEIESRLMQCPGVQKAVVIDRKDQTGDCYLMGYFVADRQLSATELRDKLSEDLPTYMVPASFMQLDNIPLKGSGKVDLAALPNPTEQFSSGAEYVAPTNEIQIQLTRIWSKVLGIEKIGIRDNFFDLGGHSLKATAVMAQIYKELHVELPLREIFKSPTIEELSQLVAAASKRMYTEIHPAKEREYYPVSSAQQRLLVLDQLERGGIHYNMPGLLILEGNVEPRRIEETFQALVERHEAFRTAFRVMDDEHVQVIYPNTEFTIEYMKMSEDQIDTLVKEFIRPFDLSKAPLLRAGLVELPTRYLLIFDMHHIISDGVSMDILKKEFVQLYAGERLPELSIQYKDYAVWQESLYGTRFIQGQEAYWLETFGGEIPALQLPTDYPRPALMQHQGDQVEFNLTPELTEQLIKFNTGDGATLFMVLVAIYSILLAKYSGQEEVIVGTPIAGRSHPDLERIIGVFVNTLAMRTYPEGEKTFKEFLREVAEQSLKAYENQDYQFEKLVDRLNIERNLSRNPLFDTMLSLKRKEALALDMTDFKVIPYEFENSTAKFDLELGAVETAEGLHFTFNYATSLFRRETVAQMGRHLLKIITEVISNPEIKLWELEILTLEERHKLVQEFNHTATPLSLEKMIDQIFSDQAVHFPDAIAVRCGELELTYDQLNKRSNQLARLLLKRGVRADQLVGVLMDRSLAMVESILAIWKAGGGYIPIDPAYPEERISGIMQDSQMTILLTQSEFLNPQLEKEYLGSIVQLDLSADEYLQESVEKLDIPRNINNLAYVIYTSGSTGKPKGAMVEHIGLQNHIQAKISDLQLTRDSIVAQSASHCFDISIWQFFSALAVGGKTVIYPNEVVLNPGEFITAIHRDQITILQVVPSYLAVVLDMLEMKPLELDHLRYLLVTGEAAKPVVIRRWFDLYPAIPVYNFYGPTEATDNVIHYLMTELPETESIPLGRPMQNFHIYIVNTHMKLCPVGVIGEICVSGPGVGRGYLNNPERTHLVFTEDPFLEEKGVRLYKTGDLGRWLPNGVIEFYGRKDHQVKIRGFRIELGEIECCLVEHPQIKDAVVLEREDQLGNKFLCGYIEPVSRELKDSANEANFGAEPSVPEIKKFLAEKLPEYMIPTHFVLLDKLPLNRNGKIDRKALPEPDSRTQIDSSYVAPVDHLERKLTQIYSEVLGVKVVGTKDDFFALGGQSLKATQLVAKVYKEFNIELPLREVFLRRTVQNLAEYIRSAEETSYFRIERAPEQEWYPVSSAQKRLYVIQQMQKGSVDYNIAVNMVIKGNLEREQFKKALTELVQRHESLRTSFELVKGELVQKIHPNVPIELFEQKAEEHELQTVVRKFVQPFDLSSVPLFRAGLIKYAENKSLFMLDLHHIIADGVSMEILIQDFCALYERRALPELKIHYKDFAVWQNTHFASSIIGEQQRYWLNQLRGLTYTKLPEKTRNHTEKAGTGQVQFIIADELALTLNAYCVQNQITKSGFLLTVFKVILYKEIDQSDLTLGIPVAQRSMSGLENMVGVLLNVLLIRTKIDDQLTFKEYVEQVQDLLIAAQGNQDYPFEELDRMLKENGQYASDDLFSILYNYLPVNNQIDLKFQGNTINPFESDGKLDAKYDCTLYVRDAVDHILLSLAYKSHLYDAYFMERILDYMVQTVKLVLQNDQMRIGEIELFAEEDDCGFDFNADFDNDDFIF